MNFGVWKLFVLFLLVHGEINAQVPQERHVLYQLVLEDFIKSGVAEQSTGFGIVDSTCQAVYYGGFADSVNKKYFGFDANNYIDGELFRRNFVDATEETEMVPLEVIADKGLIRIQKEAYRKCFTAPKESQIILTEKGFDKLNKLYQTAIYCEFSLPFFYNDHTVLIYFNYQDGLENDFPNVYLLVRKNQVWGIVERLRSWS